MKFSSIALLSTVFIAGVSADDQLLRGGRDLMGKPKKFIADLGEYGKFFIIVKDDTIKFKTSLENLDGLFDGPINYHFHSGYVAGVGGEGFSAGAGNTCGGSFTLGHYDPTLACGAASTAKVCEKKKDVDCCPEKPAPGYCNNDDVPCEVGDLSNRYGSISIVDGKAEADVEDEVFVDFLDQYLGTGTPDFETWGSVVFHDGGDNNARKLCGNLIEA